MHRVHVRSVGQCFSQLIKTRPVELCLKQGALPLGYITVAFVLYFQPKDYLYSLNYILTESFSQVALPLGPPWSLYKKF